MWYIYIYIYIYIYNLIFHFRLNFPLSDPKFIACQIISVFTFAGPSFHLIATSSSWRFVSCHLILSNLITLCSYVMHFRSRGAIERQSNTQWPTWDDTQTLPSLNMPDVTMCAQQLVYTNTTGGCKVQTLRFYSQSKISWILEAAWFDDKMVLSEVW